LVANEKLRDALLESMNETAKAKNLKGFEIVKKIHLDKTSFVL